MAIATRTVNPLHFEDLEPHRFEDMVRQLIYDLRPWKSLEAVGRSGSDEGIDIRATETTTEYLAPSVEIEAQAEEEELFETNSPERIWLIQCKRERSLAPKKIAAIVADNLKRSSPKPAVYMLVAACDFSKAARDAFRESVVTQGIEEFYIWGKAELEDLLFQPKNDHLLFAYFGISFQVRKRTLKAQFKSNYLLKKKIYSLLGDQQDDRTPVLLRDADSPGYPRVGDVDLFLRNPGWRYFEYFGPLHMDAVTFRSCSYLCYVDWEKKEFDSLNFDVSWVNYPKLSGVSRDLYFSDSLTMMCTQPLYSLWSEVTPQVNQGKIFVLDSVAYDRILLVDEVGDVNEPNHIVVQCPSHGKFFDEKPYLLVNSVGACGNQERLQGWTQVNFYEQFRTQFLDLLKDWPDILTPVAILKQG
jgi:hypothetical protein